MLIGFDISQLAYPGSGVARYTEGLVRALTHAGSPHQFLFLAFAWSNQAFFQQLNGSELLGGASVKIIPVPPSLAPYLSQFPLPLDPMLAPLDLLHTSDWVEPKTTCPKVTTIHDMVFRLYPETVDPQVLHAHTLRFQAIARDHTHLIADSQSTRQDLMQLAHFPAAQISVVYPGLTPGLAPASAAQIKQKAAKYQLPRRYLLSVGTQEPRKNLPTLLTAFTQLRSESTFQELELVLVGRYGWGEKLSSLPAGVKALGYVPDADLAALYSGAEAFVYPSLYEGFGFPVLEAMACGAPVVTSQLSSLPEIVGEAGVLVSPHNAQDLVRGIKLALQDAKSWRQAGLAQAQRFSWQQAGRQIIQLYEQIYAKSHS